MGYWLGFGWTFRRVYWWRRQRFSRQPNPKRGGRIPMPRLQQGVEIYLRISGTHVKTAQKKQNKWCVQMVFSICTAKSHYIKSVVFKLQTWSRYWILFALFDITNQKNVSTCNICLIYKYFITASDQWTDRKATDHSFPSAVSSVDFENIFFEASTSTLEKMSEDPMYKLFGDCRLDLLAKFCMEEDFFGAYFLDRLTEVFSLSLSDTSDRELLFSRIHELRLSSCLQRDCVSLFEEKGCQENREDINNFLQEYILEIPSQIRGGMRRENKKISEELSYHVSTKDQRILFYIAGSLWQTWRSAIDRPKIIRWRDLTLLKRLTSKTSDTSFVAKYDQWLSKNSRGGLVRPADNFYLLVRELEISIRKVVDFNNIHSETLTSSKMKEHMMDSFMVNYYLKEMCGDCVNSDLRTVGGHY